MFQLNYLQSVLCPVYSILPISQDCPLLLVSSVFSNVYILLFNNWKSKMSKLKLITFSIKSRTQVSICVTLIISFKYKEKLALSVIYLFDVNLNVIYNWSLNIRLVIRQSSYVYLKVK